MTTSTPVAQQSVASTERRAQVRRLLPWVLGVLAVLGALGLQSQLFLGQQRTVAAILMFVALAEAWNLIGGFTGYACFGQVVFFGIGGYFTAVAISHWHLSFWVSLLLSGVVAALFATLIGLPLLRLKGHYFAIATLGVAEGMREVVTNLPDLTGGGAGITIPTVGPDATTAYLGNEGFYVLFLALAALSVLVGGLVARSKFGYALLAIHQDEDAAAAVGINTTRMKVLAFALSGLLAGIAGIMIIAQAGAASSFGLGSDLLLPGIAAAIVGGTAITGGRTNPLNVIFGALTMTLIPIGAAILGVPPQAQSLVYGLVIIVAVALTMSRAHGQIVK